MHVKIGQIAQALGVSTHLLKHYEKLGLIQPMKDEESNYRYYDSRQCERIVECKKYRNMGLTLREISEIIGSEESGDARDVAAAQIKHIEEEIKQLEMMKRMTEIYHSRCVEYDQKKSQWFLELNPHYYFLPKSENDELIEHVAEAAQENPLIDMVPICQQMVYVKDKDHIEWGLCIEKQYFEEQGYQKGEPYLEIEPKRVFTAYFKIKSVKNIYEELEAGIKEVYPDFSREELQEVYIVYIKKEYIGKEEYYCSKIFIPSKR